MLISLFYSKKSKNYRCSLPLISWFAAGGIFLVSLVCTIPALAQAGTLTLRNVYNNNIALCDINYNPVAPPSSAGNIVLTDLPNEPLLFHVWGWPGMPAIEVPGYGILAFTAANGGAGFMPNGQTLDVIYEIARHRWLASNILLQNSETEGFVFPREVYTQLITAESYLNQAANSSGGSTQQADYALQSLQYSCPASETIVVELGRQKLLRQGGVRPDQRITVQAIYESYEGQAWRDAMDPLFNAAITWWSWYYQWRPDGSWGMDMLGQENTVPRLFQMGKKIRANGIIGLWDTPEGFEPVTLEHLIESHVDFARAMMIAYPEISNWSLAGECNYWNNLGWLEPEDFAVLIDAVSREMGSVNPNLLRGVEGGGMFSEDEAFRTELVNPRVVGEYEFYEILIDANVPFEQIGMQLYVSNRDMFEIHEMLEKYAKLGKRIITTAMQASSKDIPQPGNQSFPNGTSSQTFYRWHRDWDQELQADWLEGMFLVCLSKDYFDEWTWWDLADYEDTYHPWGGLLDTNYAPKESYYRLQELMQLWGYEKPPCTVNLNDLVSLASDWLGVPGLPGNLNNDSGVDLRDYAVLGERWQESCPQLDFYTELEVWNLADDWSDAVNPNGPWTYGGFTPFYSFRVINTHQNAWRPAELGPNQPAWADSSEANSGWCKSIGSSGMDFPQGRVGNRGKGILRWTSPIRGLIRISGGLWRARDYGGSQSWMLRHNGSTFTSGMLTWGPTSSNPLSYATGNGGDEAVILTVTEGDIIDLYLYEAFPGGDYTGVDLTIAHIVKNFKDWPWSDPYPEFEPPRQVYDLAADWNDISNPADAWSYGRYSSDSLWGGKFYSLSAHQESWLSGDLGANQPAWAEAIDSTPGWFKSTGSGQWDCPADRVGCYGPAIVRWTCPAAGTIIIDGGIWLTRNLGRDMYWKLRHNKALFTDGILTWGPTSSNPMGYSSGSGGSSCLQRTVQAGDTIELYLHKVGQYDDFVGVDLTLTYTESNLSTLQGD